MEVSANANVLTFTWHIPDGWYGSNRRFVLLPNEGEGFKTKNDAMRVRGLFVQWMNNKFDKDRKVKASDVKFGVYSQFPTYIYCGAGPSYSCTNVDITVSELEEWRQRMNANK